MTTIVAKTTQASFSGWYMNYLYEEEHKLYKQKDKGGGGEKKGERSEKGQGERERKERRSRRNGK